MWVIEGRGPSGQHGATPFLPQDEATNALPYLFVQEKTITSAIERGVDSQQITDIEKIKMWVEKPTTLIKRNQKFGDLLSDCDKWSNNKVSESYFFH